MIIDSNSIVSCCVKDGCGELYIWSTVNQFEKREIFYQDFKGRSIYSVAISPNGTFVAAGSQNGLVRVWPFFGHNLSKQMPCLFEIYHSLSPVIGLDFLSEDLLLSAGYNGKIRITSVSEAKHIDQIDAHSGPIYSIISLGTSVAASLGFDGCLKIWDMDTLRCEFQHQGTPFPKESQFVVPSLVFSGETGLLCCPSYDGKLHLFNLQNDCLHESIQAHQGSFYAMTSYHSYLSTGGFKDNKVKLWDLKSKALVSEFDAQTPIKRFCPHGKDKVAAIGVKSNKIDTIISFTIPDLIQDVLTSSREIHGLAALPPSLCERLDQEKLIEERKEFFENAKPLLSKPEQLELYIESKFKPEFEFESIMLQALSGRVRNKPLHEMKYLLQLSDQFPVSSETLPLFKHLAKLLEQFNEPALAIDIYEKMSERDENSKNDIERLRKHPLLKLIPSKTIRMDFTRPNRLYEEIEKCNILINVFCWQIIIPIQSPKIFEIKALHDLSLWDTNIRKETKSNKPQIKLVREEAVLFDGQKGASVEWLRISHTGTNYPSEDVYYAIAVKKENGIIMGEGYGVFHYHQPCLSEDVTSYNASLVESYRSVCEQRTTGDWLKNIHEVMIGFDTAVYQRTS